MWYGLGPDKMRDNSSRYYKLIRQGKARNVAVAAIARELACFVWGMMTDNISVKAV